MQGLPCSSLCALIQVHPELAARLRHGACLLRRWCGPATTSLMGTAHLQGSVSQNWTALTTVQQPVCTDPGVFQLLNASQCCCLQSPWCEVACLNK